MGSLTAVNSLERNITHWKSCGCNDVELKVKISNWSDWAYSPKENNEAKKEALSHLIE